MEIILASGSPRRKQLLTELLGDNFRIIPSDFEEDNDMNMDPIELAKEHAAGKARDVAKDHKGIIIGVDTFVLLDGKVLGKPKDEDDARQMLKKQRDRTVTCISGLCVIDTKSGKELLEAETTEVQIADIPDAEIDAYIKTGHPMDKAGSFGVQGKGALFVKSIHGDYFNVVGLPLFRLHSMLKQIGVDVFSR